MKFKIGDLVEYKGAWPHVNWSGELVVTNLGLDHTGRNRVNAKKLSTGWYVHDHEEAFELINLKKQEENANLWDKLSK